MWYVLPSTFLMCAIHKTHLEVRDPVEAMSSRTAFIDGLLVEVFRGFLSCKVNARRSEHSPRYHPIITLIIS